MSAFAIGRNAMIRTFGTSLAILALGAACASTQERSEPAPRTATTPPATEGQVVEITVTEEGFVPSPVTVREGEPLTLIVTRRIGHERERVGVVWTLAASYSGLFGVLVWQALRGQSIISPDITTLVVLAVWALATAAAVWLASSRAAISRVQAAVY